MVHLKKKKKKDLMEEEILKMRNEGLPHQLPSAVV